MFKKLEKYIVILKSSVYDVSVKCENRKVYLKKKNTILY